MNFGTGLLQAVEGVVERLDALFHPHLAVALARGPVGHADLSCFLPPVFHQHQSSTCWAHSASACFYGAHAKAGAPLPAPPSPLYFAQCVYGAGRKPGAPLLDQGADLATAAQVFAELGEVPFHTPQQGGGTDVPATLDAQGNPVPLPEPSPDDVARGRLARFDGEYAIPVGPAAPRLVMAALDAGLFVWDGFQTDAAFEQLGPRDVLGAPKGPSRGGHATLYHGYDLRPDGPVFYKRNSWGPSWCRNGDFTVSADHVRASWALWPFAVRVG